LKRIKEYRAWIIDVHSLIVRHSNPHQIGIFSHYSNKIFYSTNWRLWQKQRIEQKPENKYWIDCQRKEQSPCYPSPFKHQIDEWVWNQNSHTKHTHTHTLNKHQTYTLWFSFQREREREKKEYRDEWRFFDGKINQIKKIESERSDQTAQIPSTTQQPQHIESKHIKYYQ
jgi:hypothetical protein